MAVYVEGITRYAPAKPKMIPAHVKQKNTAKAI
jgi:hypothetical protein